jgi:hypothetical protein
MPALSDWTKANFTVDAPTPDKAVPQVTAGLAIATALLTAVGIGSGITVRILRNDPLWVVLFVLVLLSSICLAAFAAKRKWLVVAGAVFMAALGGFTWLAGDVSRAAERPHLVATAETSTAGLVKISTTVKADGLRTNLSISWRAPGARSHARCHRSNHWRTIESWGHAKGGHAAVRVKFVSRCSCQRGGFWTELLGLRRCALLFRSEPGAF